VGGNEEAAPFSEMGSVVMDHHRTVLGRDGSDRVFCTLSGPRPCEPSSLAVVAAHHSLTELLVYTRLAFERHAAELPPRGPHVAVAAAANGDQGAGSPGWSSAVAAGAAGAEARRAQLLRANFREAVVALTAPSLRNIADIVGVDAHGERSEPPEIAQGLVFTPPSLYFVVF
jgi:hypothetical protein